MCCFCLLLPPHLLIKKALARDQVCWQPKKDFRYLQCWRESLSKTLPLYWAAVYTETKIRQIQARHPLEIRAAHYFLGPFRSRSARIGGSWRCQTAFCF